MKLPHLTRQTVMIAVTGFALAVAGAAAAYWTRPVDYSCTHCGLAQSASLATPVTAASAAGGAQVDVSWGTTPAQPSGTTYVITRIGGTGGTATFTSSTTSYTDTTVSPGTSYQYDVEAVLGANWRSEVGTASATTPTDTLDISLSASSVDAGSTVSVTTITAKVGGVTDTTIDGVRTITWSGLVSSPNGSAPTYPGGNTTQTVTFVDGVATIGADARTYASGTAALTATFGPVTGSASFTVRPLAATVLSLDGTSSIGAGASATATATVQDTYGNTITSATPSITFSKSSGAGTVAGLGAVTASGGVASVNLTGNLAGDLVLQASTSGVSSATRTMSVTGFAAATQLAVTGTTAVNAGNDVTWTATVKDTYGNTVTDASNAITFTKVSGTGTALGLGSITPNNGVATATITGGYAGSLGVDVATTGLTTVGRSLTVSGYAAASATTLSTSSTVSAGGNTNVTATVVDAYGNTVANFSDAITFAHVDGTGTVGGLGTTTAVNGVASIPLTGNRSGEVVIEAAGPGITPGRAVISVSGYTTAAKIGLVGTSTLTPGSTMSLTAVVQDIYGNTVADATNRIQLSKTSGTGTVSGTGTRFASAGSVVYSIVGNVNGPVTLSATSTGLTTGTITFSVTGAGAPSAVTMSGGTTVAVGSTVDVTATVVDAYGNTVTDSDVDVVFSKASGTGTVSGLTTVTASNGVASVTLTGNLAGSLSVQAASTGLTSGSHTVTVTGYGAATTVAVTGNSTVTAGSTVTYTATVQDSYGNTVTNSAASIVFSKASGTGTVSGLTAVSATNGVASVTLTGNLAGSLSIEATTNGLTTGSRTLTVTGYAAANKVVLSGNSTVAAGSTVTYTATVQDTYGNTVANSSASIVFSKTSGTGTVSGLTTVTATNGVASVTLTGNLAGDLTVRSASTGLTSASQTLTVTGYAAANKVTVTGNSTVAAGSTVTYTATVQDTYGNTITDSEVDIVFSKASGTGTVSGLATVTASNGVATVTLTGNLAGSLSVEAASTGLTTDSQTLTVTGYAAANKITISGGIAQHRYIATIQDTYGNTITAGSDSTLSVTFTKSSGTGTVSGLGSATAVAGVATLNGVNPGIAGAIVIQAQATASTGTLTATLSDTVVFDISSGSCNSSNGRCTFSGGGARSTNGTITVTICATNSFPCASPIATATATAVNGTWTTGNSAGVARSTYYAQAKQGTASTGPTVITVTRS